MRTLFKTILDELSHSIERENQSRLGSGALPITRIQIRIVGQMSLLLNEKISATLHPLATIDVDAIWIGERALLDVLRGILKRHNLAYDEDSHLVWVAPESRFEKLYESAWVLCEVIDPLYSILSKAIKAPKKNHVLVRDAIGFYGRKLVKLLQKYGANPEEFLK